MERLNVVNFIEKSWSKSINSRFVYNSVGFWCVCTTVSKQYTQLFYELFAGAIETGGNWDVSISDNYYLSMCKNVKESKFMFFDEKKTSKSPD